MKELLIVVAIFVTTCLLLLLRSLIIGSQQAKPYRIIQLDFDVIKTVPDDRKPLDEWPSNIGLDDEPAAPVENPSADDERIEWAVMQERVSRLLP